MHNNVRWLGKCTAAASILSVGLLLLTKCNTLEISIGSIESTTPSFPSVTMPRVMVTASLPDPIFPPEPIATVTPTPLRSSTCTPTSFPTAIPSPTATPLPTRIAPKDQVPRVLLFSAEPVETVEGEGVALRWEAVGEQATICPLLGENTVGCRCLFDMPLVGSHVIKPSEIIGNYSGFQLVVEARGIRTVRGALLAVECRDALPDWFFDNPPGICPKDIPLSSYAAAQHFEHGLMIWIEAQDAYYILYDSFITPTGRQSISSTITSLQILHGPLDLTPGASPDNRVEETPPNGLLEPISGFGLVWRREVVGIEDVREGLGWAVEPEFGFDTVYQCETSCGSYWNCYLQGPEGEVFHFYWLLHFGHFWELVD